MLLAVSKALLKPKTFVCSQHIQNHFLYLGVAVASPLHMFSLLLADESTWCYTVITVLLNHDQ